VALKVTSLLLAAGESKRMGTLKQLLRIRERPAILMCLESILEAGIEDVFVVVRSREKGVLEFLQGQPVILVANDLPGSDMAASVRFGLSSIGPDATGILVSLCDYPLVSPATLGALRQEHQLRPEAIVIPRHHGKNGHPTLFPRTVLEEIRTLPTLRDIISRHHAEVTYRNVDDEGILLDMDTPEDYQRILEVSERRKIRS